MKSNIYIPFLFLFLMAFTSKAQLVEQLVARFNEFKNVTYSSTTISKDFFSDKLYFDTVKSIIAKQTNQLTYRLTGKSSENIYDGGKLFSLQFSDSTYRISSNLEAGHYYESLPYVIKRIENNLIKGKRAIQLKDSIIKGKSYSHFKLNENDGIMHDKHTFSIITLLVDKKTNFLYYYRNDSKGFIEGTKTYLTIFNEYRFTNYLVDAKHTEDLTKVLLPPHYTLEKPKVEVPLLAKGTALPEIPLYNLSGDTISISAYKGKLVLLNFTISGCPHCIEAIETLNDLSAKYKNVDFQLLSINPFDDRESILKFNERFKQNYPTFTSAKNTKEIYHINGYPTFYLIDTKGKIVKGYEGFSKAIGEQIKVEVASLVQ